MRGAIMADAASSAKRKGLTAKKVEKEAKPGRYGDGNGLMLLIKPSGAKSWVQRISIKGRMVDLGLGSVELVSLAEAREKALGNKKLSREDKDPREEKRRAEAILTFEQAAREVYRLHRPGWRNAKHAAQFISTLENYVFPVFGNQKVSDIRTGDVLSALSPIWIDKPETARRVRQRIGTVMKWCVAKGWCQFNPAADVAQALPRHDKIKEHRAALHYAEVSPCVAAVWVSKAFIFTKLCFEFLVLTAVRSGEARGAVWGEIELRYDAADKAVPSSGTWTLPAERMKAKRAHKIPLSQRAISILLEAKVLNAALGEAASAHLVFPGAKPGKSMSDMTMSKLLRELGFKTTVHGFRTSFRTWTQERTNFPREVAEAALAHTLRDKSEAAYARSDLFEKRADMMEAWGRYLVQEPADVVSIRE
jgi:integrase